MSLDYLSPFAKEINLDFLTGLKHERLGQLSLPQNSNYQRILEEISNLSSSEFTDFAGDWVTAGKKDELTSQEYEKVLSLAQELIPWKKGPFNLHGIEIDAEWRSDFKWNRLKDSLPELTNKRILDIGCNNGYFMFRMAQEKPELVMGIEPVIHNYAQFQLVNQLANLSNLHFELFGVEHIHAFENFFDVIFSMGIIYHHRHPIQQLLDIKKSMRKNGTLIIETIGIPGNESYALFPEDRYAKMRNVWFIPTLSCFINWVKKAKFKNIEVINDVPATSEEQRLTSWCPPPRQSLEDFLDPDDPTKTIEGHPAPRRFCLKATKID